MKKALEGLEIDLREFEDASPQIKKLAAVCVELLQIVKFYLK